MQQRHANVAISATANSGGAVKVILGHPFVDSRNSDLLKIDPLLTVTFADGATNTHWAKTRKARPRRVKSKFNSGSAGIPGAGIVASRHFLKRYQHSKKIEFELTVRKERQGYFVITEEIPYLPGGQTGYAISDSYKIIKLFRGR